MKAFTVALAVILASQSLSTASGIYVEHYTSKLLDAEAALTSAESKTASSDELERLEEAVIKGYELLTVICRSDQPDRIVLSVKRLKSAYEGGNEAAIITARADFRESVNALRRSEQMNIGGII